jgi:hypothetical protein
MASWAEVEARAPELAARVRRRFAMGVNKTIATLRKDGGPRISASELEFKDGELTLGMMGGSMKLLDVRRDPRIAVHCPTVDAPENERDWPGDAKLAGVVVEIPAPPDNTIEGAGFFRIDLAEVVLTYLGEPADHLIVESWHPGRGVERRKRH